MSSSQAQNPTPTLYNSEEFFLLANPPRARLIKAKDIVALYADKNCTEVQLDDEKFLVTKGLGATRERLGKSFFRANRTCAVNLGAITKAWHEKRNLFLTLRTGGKVIVSRLQARALKAMKL